MGTNVAVNLANLYLSELSDAHFTNRIEIIYWAIAIIPESTDPAVYCKAFGAKAVYKALQ